MSRRRLLILMGAATLLTVAGFVLTLWITSPTPGVTWENFRRLRQGMTEKDVVALLGESSKPDVVRFGDGHIPTHLRRWRGEEVVIYLDFSQHVVIGFPDDLKDGIAFPPALAMKFDEAMENILLAWHQKRISLAKERQRLYADLSSVARQGQVLWRDEPVLDRIRRLLHW